MQRNVLCFAHGSPGEWEAICLDYDLAAQGRSFDEVKALLERAIAAYVESAMREEPPARDALLRRRAPFWVRVGYVMRFLWAAIRHRSHGAESNAGFLIPCPA
jgi:hypothetical protein